MNFSNRLRSLEGRLSDDFATTLYEASGRDGATAWSIVAAVEKEHKDSASAAISTSAGAASQHGSMDVVNMTAAFQLVPFRELEEASRSLDLTTRAGELELLAQAFDGENVLAIRALISSSAKGLGQRPVLLLLFNMQDRIGPYLDLVLCADSVTAKVPRHMTKFSVMPKRAVPVVRGGTAQPTLADLHHMEFLAPLCGFFFERVPWVNGRGAYVDWVGFNTRSAEAPPRVNELDMYTVETIARSLGSFIHRVFVALGFPDSLDSGDEGFTWATFTVFYITHLQRALQMETLEEQYRHLTLCHTSYVEALQLTGENARRAIFGSRPAAHTLRKALFSRDSPPVQALLLAEEAWENTRAMREAIGFSLSNLGQFTAAHRMELPLRSKDPSLAAPAGRNAKQQQQQQQQQQHPQVKKPKLLQGPGPDTSSGTQASGHDVEPGSFEGTFAWLEADKLLLISGSVWFVVAIAKLYKVGVDSVCWPYVLSRRPDVKRKGCCLMWGTPGHTSDSSACHSLAGFDVKASSENTTLCRKPTAGESAKLSKQPALLRTPTASPGKGKGAGKGNGKGKGKGTPLQRGRGKAQPASS
jgi:hypothetical protein